MGFHNREPILGAKPDPSATQPCKYRHDSPIFSGNGRSISFFCQTKYDNNRARAPLSKQVAEPPKSKQQKRISSAEPRALSEASGPRNTGTYSKSLYCVGANIRSLYAVENFYALNGLLEDKNPDVVFIVETWHQEEEPKPLPNKNYNILLSRIDSSRGGGVAILHRSTLIVVPLFPEFHCRNFLLTRVSSLSARPIFLLCAYFPPDHGRKVEMLAKLSRVIEFLRARYSSFSLLGFGDLNSDLVNAPASPDSKRALAALKRCNISLAFSDRDGAYTRSQSGRQSYLDYFLSVNVEVTGVQIGPPLGRSDHLVLSSQVTNCCPVRRKRGLVFSKKRAAELLARMNRDGEMAELLSLPPVEFFRRLSGRLKSYALIYEPRCKSYFHAIAAVDREIHSTEPDWTKVKRAILRCRGAEFLELLEKLNSLKRSNKMGQFFAVTAGLLRLKKQAFTLREIEDPSNPGTVLHEPERIRTIISRRYQSLFLSDAAQPPLAVSNIEPVSLAELLRAAQSVSVGKGLGIDCIPDVLLKLATPEVLVKLTAFVNTIFSRRAIPTPFKFARLHLLNKLRGGVPGLDDLRPIMISSPIMKLIESIALHDLKETLEPKITASQVGFLSTLSTQIHLLRLVGKIIDLKGHPRFVTGNWFILFIDFKAAFDRVDHGILFSKLSETGVKEKTLNIMKLLYNSYHFTLPGDKPARINSGVAQGSLISPLLYDWYVNDLVSELSGLFGRAYTFAYADDIAVLCLGYSEVRTALAKTEEWAKRNGALINKKKCGILRISRRETPIGIRSLMGVALVHDYKYLGVPLDQSFSLKYLVLLLRKRVKAFCARIHVIMHSVVGLKVKFDLWQSYARCHFDYFAPVIALCGHLNKFETLYTKSLKKALDLPQQTPNLPLLAALGVPSLRQIAAHHIHRNTKAIRDRFSEWPVSLGDLCTKLEPCAEEYVELQAPVPISGQSEGLFVIDLLASKTRLNKCLLGLVAGTFLTIRYSDSRMGNIGQIRDCPKCREPATQKHFLDTCPINGTARGILCYSVPPWVSVEHLVSRDFDAFFKNIRRIHVRIKRPDGLEQLRDSLYENMANAASAMAEVFTRNTLELLG